ncbi:MAG: tRNA epoxyqueuosine(34) reductase QueG [Parachlamydiales bacterium]|jgi:epoxyqueuosine reductase
MSSSLTVEDVRLKALELGWDDVGVTTPAIPDEDIAAYRKWLENGRQADLTYMENDLRTAPDRLLPGAKTAFLFVTNYKQPQHPLKGPDEGLIASYARHRDYHNVHRRRLKKLIRWLESQTQQTNIAIGFSDSKPIMEKSLFVKAGLGWFGKNTLLIHRRFGTFILLSGLLTTLEFPDLPCLPTHIPKCGVCTKCLDACPTQALVAPYLLDANRCLSYHLIEKDGPIDPEIARLNPGYAFGCDICQNICPHNVRSPLSTNADFLPVAENKIYLSLEKLAHLDTLDGSPLKRRGIEGLKLTLEQLKEK